MNILFLSYWGINEGLSQATVIPHLKILSGLSRVDKIIYVSIERNHEKIEPLQIEKLEHRPLYSRNISPYYLNKIYDFTWMPKKLVYWCELEKIDKVICRSSMAGALGWMVWKKIKIPFYVESFEPHSEYMREAGVWKIYDPRYWFQKYWEKQQKRYAKLLMPVSNKYREYLIKEGVSELKIKVVPCAVNIEKFKFNEHERKKIRQQLNISDRTVVGIYVGKFGGIYYSVEALDILKICQDTINDCFIIVLSNQSRNMIKTGMQKFGIDVKRVLIDQVEYNQVPAYLSSADFAFCFHKPHNFSMAYSPIKNGEYWANGLPIIMSNNIGDDSDIIKREEVGMLYYPGDNLSLIRYLKLISPLISKKERESFKLIANSYRSFNFTNSAYNMIINER